MRYTSRHRHGRRRSGWGGEGREGGGAGEDGEAFRFAHTRVIGQGGVKGATEKGHGHIHIHMHMHAHMHMHVHMHIGKGHRTICK